MIVVCERGANSEAAARFLTDQGFTNVATMSGGNACLGPGRSSPAADNQTIRQVRSFD